MQRIASTVGVVALTLFLASGMTFAQHCTGARTNQPETTLEMGMATPMMNPMGRMMPKMMGCCMAHGDMMGECMMGASACKALCQFGCPCLYEKHAEELELSDQQVQKLKSIRSAQQKDVIRKRAEIKIVEIELGEILGQDAIDFSKARAKITQIGSLKQEVRLGRLSSMEKAQKVLTAEQWATFNALKGKSCSGMMGKGMMKKCMMKGGK